MRYKRALVEFGDLIKNEDRDTYNCTIWCRFPMYKTNFGWGKPSWVSISSVTFKNVMLLIDTKDGDGIEAWLTFKDEDMFLFERNKYVIIVWFQLLHFGSFFCFNFINIRSWYVMSDYLLLTGIFLGII